MGNDSYYIFGIQRSGTNYLETLIEKNFSVRKNNPSTRCWKHSIDMPAGLDPKQPIIVIHKNPYLWVESIAWRNRVDWIKTQTMYPATDVADDQRMMIGENGKQMNLINLTKTYKHFYNTWFINPDDMIKETRLVIRYEDLLENEKRGKILGKIHKIFNFRRKTNPLHQGWANPRIGTISQSRDYNATRHHYYTQMKPKYLKPHHIAQMNDILGKTMFNRMRYDML